MQKDKITELTYENLKEMNKMTFGKLFKKPATWKKAKGVLFFAKHKLKNGKVPLVAVPFKKYNEAAKCFKDTVKKAENYTPKLTLLASFEWHKNLENNMMVSITPVQGAMNLEYIETYGKELFGRLKVDFEVVGAKEMLTEEGVKEVFTASGKELSDKKATKLVERRNKRRLKFKKMNENVSKFETLIGEVALPTLTAKLGTYKTLLIELKAEALEDGKIDEDEKIEIARLEGNIQQLETTIKKEAAIGFIPLSPKEKETMFKGIDQMKSYMDKLTKEYKLLLK